MAPAAHRRAARLAAVQALYSLEVEPKQSMDAVLAKMTEQQDDELVEKLAAPERKFLKRIVVGVSGNQQEIDGAITHYLKPGWTLDRLDTLLKAMLRAGVYELIHEPKVPTRTVLDEYITIADAFYDSKEVGFINAILDSVAAAVRK